MTDFEECGLGGERLSIPGHQLLLSVDFEAFEARHVGAWRAAMEYWAVRARESGLRFAFFLSIEHAVELRVAGRGFSDLCAGLAALGQAGSSFHPHNHFAFDPETGVRRMPAESVGDVRTVYSKRRSFFYDVVHRSRIDLPDWLATVRRLHEELLAEMDQDPPPVPVFRAGGWDYGGTCDDLRAYLDALAAAGFRVESSACRGHFGTSTWRVGAETGANVFRLHGGLLEVAPTIGVAVTAAAGSFAYLRSLREMAGAAFRLRRSGGVAVVVIHFDHLFHNWAEGKFDYFSVLDDSTVRARIDGVFRLLRGIRAFFRLTSTDFDAVVSQSER